ncbi:MAG: YiiD C-terminal domain-containing protein [Verrucomicrobiota bacterium]
MDITEIPFNRLVGLVRAEKAGKVLSLPDDVRYTNHLGTIHASALLTLAEATSGEYMIRELANPGFEVLPVVRRVEAKYRKPARGVVYSSVTVPPEKKAEFIATLTARGRALLEIQVDVHDEQETHLVTVMVEWFVAKR